MNVFKTGDRVRLLKLENWFFKDLPAEDVAFLKVCVGEQTEVLGYDDYGHVELEFERRQSGGVYRTHTVWVDEGWIEKV